MVKTGKPAHRPTIYTKKLGGNICKRIATSESVRKISEDKDMPNASTIHSWVLDNEEFSKQYARAKAIGSEIEFEELDEIAIKEKDIQRAKLRIDTKKWSLSKKIPKKYGDKLDMTSDGKAIQGNQIIFADFKENETDSK